MPNNKKAEEMDPTVAAIVGAAAGAMIGAAATTMTDPKKRQFVKKAAKKTLNKIEAEVKKFRQEIANQFNEE